METKIGGKMQKILKWFIICVVLMIIGIIIVSIINNNVKNKNLAYNIQVEQGYIHLTDEYDEKGINMDVFFSNDKSKSILINTLKSLEKEEDYYYLDGQNIYVNNYTEIFKNDLFFVPNNDSSLIEKDIAPIKSLQGDSRFFNACDLKNTNGKEIDFNKYNSKPIEIYSDKPISIILGNRFKKYLDKGDIVSGTIYRGLRLKFVVKDFLSQKAHVTSGKYKKAIDEFFTDDSMDGCVIIPNFKLQENDKDGFKNWMINLCQRCEGIYFVKSKSDCNKKIDNIKKIKERTGFKFSTYYEPE